jgi:hypothetical protein
MGFDLSSIGSLFGGSGGGFAGILGGGGYDQFAGLISSSTAYGAGVQAGQTTNLLEQNGPLGGLFSSFSPANLDPTGLLPKLGGFLEDNADTILPIAGTIVGAYFGMPGLGNKAGIAAAGIVDAKSDQPGIFDLDGKETRQASQARLGLPSSSEGFLSR